MAVGMTQNENSEGQKSQAAVRETKIESSNIGRREAIRKLAVGAATLAGVSALPEIWTTPFAEFGSLPAHAATSGQPKDSTEKTEVIPKSGYISIDKVLRPKFIAKKLGTAYGKSMRIEFDTGGVIHVPDTRHDVITREDRVYRWGGRKDIPTMEVYDHPKSKATSITIFYKG